MANLTDFLPLFDETTETIRARLDNDVNAGLTVGDVRWVDTREGSFYYDVTQPVVLEIARLWDSLSTEMPAAAFVEFAWGEYLDYHAAVFNLSRKPAVAATGTVLFTGDAGAFVSAGTVVATDSPNDGDVLEFTTTASGTLSAALAAPTGLTATPFTTGGTLPAGTFYYRVTALSSYGETLGSVEASATVTGATSRIALSWSAVAGATGYRVYRATAPGGLGVEVYDEAATSAVDTGFIGGSVGPPTINSTAGLRLPVVASEIGSLGNVGAGAIIALETPNDAIDAVTNETETGSGADEETDTALRERIQLEYGGQGAGNINDYKRWALAIPGVGRVFVRAAGFGAGTVQVVIMDATGGAVSAETVAALQADLDPVAGQGKGRAPVGVTVTVQTPTIVGIDVLASVVFKSGYSLDGGGGLIALRSQIVAAIAEYVNGLDVGDDVVYQNVLAAFFSVRGVLSVSSLTVEGSSSANVVIPDSPATIAQLATVGLS